MLIHIFHCNRQPVMKMLTHMNDVSVFSILEIKLQDNFKLQVLDHISLDNCFWLY